MPHLFEVRDIVRIAMFDAARAAGLHKLISRIFPENTTSRSLMNALGFAEIGMHRHGKLDGEWSLAFGRIALFALIGLALLRWVGRSARTPVLGAAD